MRSFCLWGGDFDVAETGIFCWEGVQSVLGGYVKVCCLDISSMWMCGVTRSGGVCGGARRPGRSQLEVTWTS